jgi:hypothetical protein
MKSENRPLKIRCSSLSKIMGAPRGTAFTEKQAELLQELEAKPKLTDKQMETKNSLIAKRDAPPVLADTGKSYVEELFIERKYGRIKDIINRYISKGLAVEEDSITLYSRIKKQYFIKNEELFFNDYIVGTPDLIHPTADKIITEIVDVKSAWDIWTFMNSKRELNNAYYWQVQGYMALTGANKARVAYCLIDTPEVLLNDEKRRLMYKMGALTDESPEYLSACKQLEKLHRFDDIPLADRIVEWDIDRNDSDIKKIYAHVEMARAYYKELEG